MARGRNTQIQLEQEEVKLFLLADNMTLDIKVPKGKSPTENSEIR
jgi:hypothetical protein